MLDRRTIVYTIVRNYNIEHHEFVMSYQGNIKFLKLYTQVSRVTFRKYSVGL